MQTIFQIFKFLFKVGLLVCLFIISLVILVNLFIIKTSQDRIKLNLEELDQDYIVDNVPVLVLGAGVINNQRPSGILQERLDKAVEIYQSYPNKVFIMSGDHREDNYNEVSVMKQYLMDKGIPSQQIYLDHAGYSTYDSIYRLKKVLKVDKAILVSQAYHLPRALQLSKKLCLDSLGLAANEIESTRIKREFREVFARLKDFAVCYLAYQPEEPESNLAFNLYESGDLTNNKEALIK